MTKHPGWFNRFTAKPFALTGTAYHAADMEAAVRDYCEALDAIERLKLDGTMLDFFDDQTWLPSGGGVYTFRVENVDSACDNIREVIAGAIEAQSKKGPAKPKDRARALRNALIWDSRVEPRPRTWEAFVAVQDQLEQLEAENKSLRKNLRALIGAMHDYEMDVDELPPQKHRAMMREAEDALTPTSDEPKTEAP